MFKKQFPILIMVLMGFISLLGYFINNPILREFVDNDANQWYMIIAGFAAFLGVVNLLQLHSKKIAYKKKNWKYSILTLLSFFIMIYFGFIYTGLDGEVLTYNNGKYNEGEIFVDENNNGKYDEGENFSDLGNGKYDLAEDYTDNNYGQIDFLECNAIENAVFYPEKYFNLLPFYKNKGYCGNGSYDENEHFEDYNQNGIFDLLSESYIDGNEKYDKGEFFIDGNDEYDIDEDYIDNNFGYMDESDCYVLGLNEKWDSDENFSDLNNNMIWDHSEKFIDCNIEKTICEDDEEWVDSLGNGMYDFGEVFEDKGNGRWDLLEDFVDINNNCRYDKGESYLDLGDNIWNDAEPFEDKSRTVFKDREGYRFGFIPYWLDEGFCGNGKWDGNEEYIDNNNNGNWDNGEKFTDIGDGEWDENEEYVDSNNNGKWDNGEKFIDIGNREWDKSELFIDSNNQIYDDEDKCICEYVESDELCINKTISIYIDNNNESSNKYLCLQIPSGCKECYIDEKNDKYDQGEEFIDLGNGKYDPPQGYIDENYGVLTALECSQKESSTFYINEKFGTCGDGIYNEGEFYVDEKNGKYDLGEEYIDNNYGKEKSRNSTYTISEKTCDTFPNSVFYPDVEATDCEDVGWCGNGLYDDNWFYSEIYFDNYNDKYDKGEKFIDNNHGIMTKSECSQIVYSVFNNVPCGNCGDGEYNPPVSRGAHLKDERTMFYWLFDNIYIPLGSTMFALLAFFVASASYRAFKIRNFEATLLLISGILLMLGRVPVGAMIPWFMVVVMYISFLFALIASKFKNKKIFFGLYLFINMVSILLVRIFGLHTYSFLNISKIQEWIFDVPATAGARAIMIGIALGVVAQSFRIMTGREKSILGE